MKNSKTTTTTSISMATSTPPQPSHRQRQPSSPPVYSPAFSPASSDHSSLSFFSPRGGFDDEDPHPHHFRPSPIMTASKSIREEEHESGSEASSLSPALSPVIITTKSVREQPVMLTKLELGPEEETTSTVAVKADGQKSKNYHYSYGEDNFSDDEDKSKKETSAAGGYRRITGVELLLRLVGMMTCMISFSVMVADKHRGWALDSYDRYKEFRYCMWMNVMGFVYSGAQACDLFFNMSSDKYSDQQHLLRYYLDFFTDQVLAYLLVSASSSAATRIEDWEWNWGKDKFTQMATASVALSFLAFMILAMSSLLSGYNLCSNKFL